MQKEIIAGIVIGALLVGILWALLPSASTASVGESALQKTILTKTLHACYIVHPATVNKDPNTGALSGEMIDAIRYIASKNDWKIEFSESSWGTFIAALQSKQCDVVVTGLFSTIERAPSVAFTRPMFYIGNSVLVRRGETRFKELSDFDKPSVRIVVLQGEIGHLYAQKNLKNATVTVLQGADLSLPLEQVRLGQADAAFTEEWVIERYTQAHPDTVNFLSLNPKATYGINPVTWAVRHEDSDLLNFLNTSINYLEAEGKFQELEQKYDLHWLRPAFRLEKS